MANITIRDLPDKTKEILRVQAAQSGISLEAHARLILQQASSVKTFTPINILNLAEQYFGPENGIDLKMPKRGSTRKPVAFST